MYLWEIMLYSRKQNCKMILLLWGKHLVSHFNLWWYTSVGTKVVHRHLVPQMTFCHLRTRSCVPIDKLTININRKYRHEIWVLLVPYVSIIKSVKQTFMRHENENKWIWYWSYPYIHISLYYQHSQTDSSFNRIVANCSTSWCSAKAVLRKTRANTISAWKLNIV